MKKDDNAQGFMRPHRQKGFFGAFSSLGHFVFVFQPSSCLPPLNPSLAFPCPCGLSGHGSPICRSAMQQSSIRNRFHLPLVLDQNTKSKCASISIANVQGNGVEIICSLKKKSEEMLFSAPCVLQNISLLTPSCRSCAGWAFWYRSQSVPEVLGIYQRRSGCGSVSPFQVRAAAQPVRVQGLLTLESAAATTLKPFPVHQGRHHLFSHL